MQRLRVLVVVAVVVLGTSLAAAGAGSGPKSSGDTAVESGGATPTKVNNQGHGDSPSGALVRFHSQDGEGGALRGDLRARGGGAEILVVGPFGAAREAAFGWLAVALGGEGTDSVMAVQFHAHDLGGGTWRCAAVSFSAPMLLPGTTSLSPESFTVRLERVSAEAAVGVTKCALHSAAPAPGPAAMSARAPDPYSAMHFALELDGSFANTTGFFKEVSGLSVEAEVVEYQEGGVNNVTKHLRPSHWGGILLSNLTLTRCVPGGDSTWSDWFDSSSGPNGEPPKAEMVFSYTTARNQSLLTLNYTGVVPVSWSLDPPANNGNVVCETLVVRPASLRLS